MSIFLIIAGILLIVGIVVVRILNLDMREVVELARDFRGYIITVVLFVLIFVVLVNFQPIAGNSMFPTLEEGDVIVCSKLFFNKNNIKRNQIVVLKAENNKSFVKRVIGLPGERIDYMDGKLYIDKKPHNEMFLGSDVVTNNFMFEDICSEKDCPEGIIPKDMYLVLGDNRPQSEDSRKKEFGLIPKEDIKCDVLMRIWPLNKIGSV